MMALNDDDGRLSSNAVDRCRLSSSDDNDDRCRLSSSDDNDDSIRMTTTMRTTMVAVINDN